MMLMSVWSTHIVLQSNKKPWNTEFLLDSCRHSLRYWIIHRQTQLALVTDRVAVSQVVDWSTCGLVDSLKYLMENLQ